MQLQLPPEHPARIIGLLALALLWSIIQRVRWTWGLCLLDLLLAGFVYSLSPLLAFLLVLGSVMALVVLVLPNWPLIPRTHWSPASQADAAAAPEAPDSTAAPQ